MSCPIPSRILLGIFYQIKDDCFFFPWTEFISKLSHCVCFSIPNIGWGNIVEDNKLEWRLGGYEIPDTPPGVNVSESFHQDGGELGKENRGVV